MKIEVQLENHPKATHEGEKITWQYENGCVEIRTGEELTASYRYDQVLWVRRADER